MGVNSKFPYIRNDIVYGFKPGSYLIPYGTTPPPEWKEGMSRLWNQVRKVSALTYYSFMQELENEEAVKWFFFEGEWRVLEWDDILNPLNLKLCREYNEELQKHRE